MRKTRKCLTSVMPIKQSQSCFFYLHPLPLATLIHSRKRKIRCSFLDCLITSMGAVPFSRNMSCATPVPKSAVSNQLSPPGMPAEAIISLAFGLTMFLLALLTLWQGHKHRQTLLMNRQPSQQTIQAVFAIQPSSIERCRNRRPTRTIRKSLSKGRHRVSCPCSCPNVDSHMQTSLS